MNDTEMEDMRRETERLHAEANLVEARKALERAKKSDFETMAYPVLAGICIVLIPLAIAKIVLG